MEMVELFEEYNEKGVCVKRTINGIEIPADTEPSIEILMNCRSITHKRFMTPKEAKELYHI